MSKILYLLKKLHIEIVFISRIIKCFIFLIIDIIKSIWFNIEKILKKIKHFIKLVILKFRLIWVKIKKIFYKIKSLIGTIINKVKSLWYSIKNGINKIYMFWIRTKEIRDIIDSIGRKLAQIIRKIINKIYFILMLILVFSFNLFLTLPILFCLSAFIVAIPVMLCVGSVYIVQYGIKHWPEYFIEAPTILENILPDFFIHHCKVTVEFTVADFFHWRFRDLLLMYWSEYAFNIMLMATSLWCTINLFYAPTFASKILDETIKIKETKIVEETIEKKKDQIVKKNKIDHSIWIKMYAFILCFILGIPILVMLCLLLALVFVCFLWGLIYISQQNIMSWSEYFSTIYDIKLPNSIINYLKKPDKINFENLYTFVWYFYIEKREELLWIVSCLICTINLWWMPSSARKLENEMLRNEGNKKREERKDEEIFDDEVPTLKEMYKEIRTKVAKEEDEILTSKEEMSKEIRPKVVKEEEVPTPKEEMSKKILK